MIMYGLRIKGKKELLKVTTSSNADGEYCCETQYILLESTWGDCPYWLTHSRDTADRVARQSTEWYNAGYETPTWDNKDWVLEIVEVEINVKE